MFFSIVSNQAELVEDKFRIINLGLWQPISGHRRAELMMSPNKWRECGMNRAGITQPGTTPFQAICADILQHFYYRIIGFFGPSISI